jgi:hypothetical protein
MVFNGLFSDEEGRIEKLTVVGVGEPGERKADVRQSGELVASVKPHGTYP